MGTLRILLAIAVVLQHVGQIGPFQFVDAGVAVFSFFIISGFYMSLVLNTKYVGPGSVPTFYINRYVRLWPTYAISLVLMFLVMWKINSLPGLISTLKSFPGEWTFAVLFSNLSLVGLDIFTHISLGPEGAAFAEAGRSQAHNGNIFIFNMPAWTIWIELMFYLVAPFVVRSFRATLLFMMVGVVFSLSLRVLPQELIGQYRYDLYYPYFLPFFGIGALMFWLSRRETPATSAAYFFVLLVALAFLAAPLHYGSSFYLVLALAIPKLFELTKNIRFDKFVGDLSYPVYILHWPVHSLVAPYDFFPSKPAQSLLATLALGIIVVLLVERPIARIRERWTMRKIHVYKR